MQHRLEYSLFRVFHWIVLALPLKSAQRLGAYLGAASFHLLGSRRHIALENLRYAFPEKSERERTAIAKGAFVNYGVTLVEFLWSPNLSDAILRKLVRMKNPELLTEAHRLGRGMVLLSGHFGNWELIASGVPRLTGIPFTIIVQTQANKLIDRLINGLRCRFGNSVIPMGISVRGIIKTLGEGGVIAIAPDQSGPMEGAFVQFFGRSVATHQGPAAFALRSRAPMLIGFMIRKSDGTYEVVLEEIPTSDLGESTDEKIIELTQRHTAMLEKYIRLYPDHWLWMHRRWKHTWESVQSSKQTVDSPSA